MIRLLVWGVVIYFLFSLVRNLIRGIFRIPQQPPERQRPPDPPPYDPSMVEDIDYEEIRRDK